MSGDGESFLSRWSRRKRAVGTAPPSPPAAPAPSEAVAPSPAATEPAFDPANLPPLDSLIAESDFAAFLRKEVPSALRRAALRRAWTLDPAIRDFVGPADYAWDYNAPDGVPGFSPNLGGDVKRLIAQAVGLAEEAPSVEKPSSEPTPPPATLAEIAAPAADTSPAEASPPESPKEPALDPQAKSLAELSPTRRRHGSALPT